MTHQSELRQKIKNGSCYRNNVDAALFAATRGVPYLTIKEKLFPLPAESRLSSFTVGDYISHLELVGRLEIGPGFKIAICDRGLENWIKLREPYVKSLLSDYGIALE